MAITFSPVLGVLCFKPSPKYFNVWYEGGIVTYKLEEQCWAIMALLLQEILFNVSKFLFNNVFLRYSAIEQGIWLDLQYTCEFLAYLLKNLIKYDFEVSISSLL